METKNSMHLNSNKLLLPSGNLTSFKESISITLFVYRLFPKKVELQALMKYYDVDGDGNVSYEEFIRGLR